MEKLLIVGTGPGGADYMTPKGRHFIQTAKRVLATARVGESIENVSVMGLTDMLAELEKPAGGDTAVLVSGDCGFFSAAKSIVSRFVTRYNIESVCGISSLQYFCAKLGKSYDDAVFISLHGRSGRIVPRVSYNRKVFALTGGATRAHHVCRTLCEAGLGGVAVHIGENLSYPNERISSGTAADFQHETFGDLSVLLIEHEQAANPFSPLSDDGFIRGSVPMTKAEVRWVSLQKLGVLPGDVVYDVGAGTGSVSVELSRKAFEGVVYAVEVKPEAVEFIHHNRLKYKAFNMTVVEGGAPEALAELEPPDKAFIGGSGGSIGAILQALAAKNPKVKVTVNVVTLQSLAETLAAFEKHCFTKTDIVCVNVARAQKTGRYDLMAAQNPVYILTGSREE